MAYTNQKKNMIQLYAVYKKLTSNTYNRGVESMEEDIPC